MTWDQYRGRLRKVLDLDTCPTDEAIAAFIDNGLGLIERQRTVAHLAQCPRCVELVAGVAEIKNELQEGDSNGGLS